MIILSSFGGTQLENHVDFDGTRRRNEWKDREREPKYWFFHATTGIFIHREYIYATVQLFTFFFLFLLFRPFCYLLLHIYIHYYYLSYAIRYPLLNNRKEKTSFSNSGIPPRNGTGGSLLPYPRIYCRPDTLITR